MARCVFFGHTHRAMFCSSELCNNDLLLFSLLVAGYAAKAIYLSLVSLGGRWCKLEISYVFEGLGFMVFLFVNG